MQAGRSRWAGSGKRGGRAWRPGLEQLENRLAPSVYQVNTVLDTPVADPHTGQDAAGHVSLRSAVAAANANPQSDTVFLPTGAYTVPAGGLAVQGNLLIQGEGPKTTLVQAQHLDRLFTVRDGHLELSGLDLEGGSPSTLLQGDIHLTNCQVSDADIAAVVHARLTSGPTTPVLEYAPGAPTLSKQEIPKPVPLPTISERLIGRSGGASSWRSADSPQDGRDAHQSFWRGEAETVPEQAAPDKPDDVKLKVPSRDEAFAPQIGDAGWHALESAKRVVDADSPHHALRALPGVPPNPVSLSVGEIVKSKRWESDQFFDACPQLWFGVQDGQGIALVVFVAIGITSLPRPGKNVFRQPGTVSKRRQTASWRWSSMLGQTQRGPPVGRGRRSNRRQCNPQGQTEMSALFCWEVAA